MSLTETENRKEKTENRLLKSCAIKGPLSESFKLRRTGGTPVPSGLRAIFDSRLGRPVAAKIWRAQPALEVRAQAGSLCHQVAVGQDGPKDRKQKTEDGFWAWPF
jgi:hypothetical protein